MENERFEECFRSYKDFVFRIIMSKTKDYSASEEICQKVFISFYVNMDKVKPAYEKYWLVRCAQNAVIDYYRAKKNELFAEISVAESGNILIQECIGLHEDKLANQELAGKIFREVKRVNQEWFEILMLCLVEGFSYEETAKLLNISSAAVRGKLYRVKAFIRKRFSEEYKSVK